MYTVINNLNNICGLVYATVTDYVIGSGDIEDAENTQHSTQESFMIGINREGKIVDRAQAIEVENPGVVEEAWSKGFAHKVDIEEISVDIDEYPVKITRVVSAVRVDVSWHNEAEDLHIFGTFIPKSCLGKLRKLKIYKMMIPALRLQRMIEGVNAALDREIEAFGIGSSSDEERYMGWLPAGLARGLNNMLSGGILGTGKFEKAMISWNSYESSMISYVPRDVDSPYPTWYITWRGRTWGIA